MRLLNSKKGQGMDRLSVMLFLFIMGFMSILGYLLLASFVSEFSATSFYSAEVQDVGEKFLAGIGLFDVILVLVMVILIIGIGITSYKLATPPVFFLITFVTGAIYGFISYFFNYIFSQMISDTMFTATLLHFPLTVLICTNLHWVMLICIIVGSITLYAKKERGQYLA